MEGPFVGNGDSSIMFGPDPKVPTAAETARCAKRFGWIRADTVSMVKAPDAREAEGEARNRSVGRSKTSSLT